MLHVHNSARLFLAIYKMDSVPSTIVNGHQSKIKMEQTILEKDNEDGKETWMSSGVNKQLLYFIATGFLQFQNKSLKQGNRMEYIFGIDSTS